VLTRESRADAEARPYHHGDLRNALVEAAYAELQREGQAGLSLRAVAREAGVSPAAPYHHFKDKSELLDAVTDTCFEGLLARMLEARAAFPDDALTAMGVAYVVFARENPARYRVMWDCMRDKSKMPEDVARDGPTAYSLVRDELIASGAAAADDEVGIEVATGALWCAVHGLAEMAGFEHFQPLIAACGGEIPFYRATLSHIGHLNKA
jgi:AcrR family transcriptional regulator